MRAILDNLERELHAFNALQHNLDVRYATRLTQTFRYYSRGTGEERLLDPPGSRVYARERNSAAVINAIPARG